MNDMARAIPEMIAKMRAFNAAEDAREARAAKRSARTVRLATVTPIGVNA